MLQAAPSVITEPGGFNFFLNYTRSHLPKQLCLPLPKRWQSLCEEQVGWEAWNHRSVRISQLKPPLAGSLTRVINESLAESPAAAARGRGPPVTAGP